MKEVRQYLLLCSLFFALLLCSCQADAQGDTQPTTEVQQSTSTDTTTEQATTTEPVIGLNFSDVLAAVNERHQSVVKPSDSLLEKLTEGRVPDTSKIGNFSSDTQPLSEIPAEDAIADTLDLFELIKDCYGGYVYFGGAEVFDPAREAIIDELSGYDSVTDIEFSEILARNIFSIVTDNHFTIGGRRGQYEAAYYYNSGDGFAKDEGGFINIVSGKRLKAVEGYDIDEIFRLHVNDTGELVWHPVVLVHSGGYSHEITLEYEDGSKQAMRLYTYTTPRSPSGVSLDRSSGFPVITISQMGFDATEAGEGARQFLRYAEEMADEKVVIVDLRGNPGGNGTLPRKWMHILTGEIVPQNHVILRAMPFEPIDERDEDKDSIYYVTNEDIRLYYSSAEYANGYTLMGGDADAFIEREQILILLVSRNTASAAEGLTDLCFNVQNTLIVGSNTGGVLNFDLTYPNKKLPRSGMDFGLGTSLFLHPEGHLIEGLGILPDIWAEGDALKAVIAMLKNAGY